MVYCCKSENATSEKSATKRHFRQELKSESRKGRTEKPAFVSFGKTASVELEARRLFPPVRLLMSNRREEPPRLQLAPHLLEQSTLLRFVLPFRKILFLMCCAHGAVCKRHLSVTFLTMHQLPRRPSARSRTGRIKIDSPCINTHHLPAVCAVHFLTIC